MADLTGNNPLIADGDFDIEVIQGGTYQVGINYRAGTGNITLKYNDTASVLQVAGLSASAFVNYQAAVTADAIINIISLSGILRFTVDTASGLSATIQMKRIL